MFDVRLAILKVIIYLRLCILEHKTVKTVVNSHNDGFDHAVCSSDIDIDMCKCDDMYCGIIQKYGLKKCKA